MEVTLTSRNQLRNILLTLLLKNDGGKLAAFDNTDTSLDSTFKKAAFGLKQGSFSTTEPVKTEYGYKAIYSIKNPGKGKCQIILLN